MPGTPLPMHGGHAHSALGTASDHDDDSTNQNGASVATALEHAEPTEEALEHPPASRQDTARIQVTSTSQLDIPMASSATSRGAEETSSTVVGSPQSGVSSTAKQASHFRLPSLFHRRKASSNAIATHSSPTLFQPVFSNNTPNSFSQISTAESPRQSLHGAGMSPMAPLSPSGSRPGTPGGLTSEFKVDPATGQVFVRETKVMVKQVDPVTGQKMINNYVMVKELGRGVHGKVKLCMDTESNEHFAIKIIPKQARRKFGQRAEDALEKVRREIAIMKRCSHPNVVRLFEVIDDPNEQKMYLVLEYVNGGEMVWRNEETDSPVLAFEEARRFFLDIVCGLEYLHYQGIIHRDIKPQNILISRLETGESIAKIADFGVSHLSAVEDLQSSSHSAVETELELAKTAGTPAFFAPELCTDDISAAASRRVSATIEASPDPHAPTDMHALFEKLSMEPTSSHSDSSAPPRGMFFFEESTTSTEDFPTLSRHPIESEQHLPYHRHPLQRQPTDTTMRSRQVGKAIDIWALGVTLYCLVYGRLPFQAQSEYELFTLIPRQPVPFPTNTIHGDLAATQPDFVDIVQRLLAKRPEERIALADVKRHSWVQPVVPGQTAEEKRVWMEESSPEFFCRRQLEMSRTTEGYTEDGRIVVTDDEVKRAYAAGFVVKKWVASMRRRMSSWLSSSASNASLPSNPETPTSSTLGKSPASPKKPSLWRRLSQSQNNMTESSASLGSALSHAQESGAEQPHSAIQTAPKDVDVQEANTASRPTSSHRRTRSASSSQRMLKLFMKKPGVSVDVAEDGKIFEPSLSSPLAYQRGVLPEELQGDEGEEDAEEERRRRSLYEKEDH